MAEFSQWIDGLLAAEGGYAPEDNKAGAVNFGLTQTFLDQHGLGDDLQTMSRERAVEVYRQYFWDKLSLSYIHDQRLANLVGHMAVNQGQFTGAAFLQAAANDLGADLEKDGAIGAKTLYAANSLSVGALILGVKYHALVRYVKLAVSNPKLYLDDLKGWMNRLESL